MKRRLVWFMGFLSLVTAGCAALAGDWPDRNGRTPEQMLADLIRWQQIKNVKTSTGILAHECFTEEYDLKPFKIANRPRQIVAQLRQAKDFQIVAAALRTIPREKLSEVILAASRIARPTWRQMGFIDPKGRGQTEAGQEAELMIAVAIADAFAVEVGAR